MSYWQVRNEDNWMRGSEREREREGESERESEREKEVASGTDVLMVFETVCVLQ